MEKRVRCCIPVWHQGKCGLRLVGLSSLTFLKKLGMRNIQNIVAVSPLCSGLLEIPEIQGG